MVSYSRGRKVTEVTPERFAEKVRSTLDSGISQRKLAEMLKASPGSVAQWARGLSLPSESELGELNHRYNYVVANYERWRKSAAENVADKTGLSRTRALAEVDGPSSDFRRLYREAEESGWSREAGDPFALLLEEIGYRTPGATYDVDDTPEGE